MAYILCGPLSCSPGLGACVRLLWGRCELLVRTRFLIAYGGLVPRFGLFVRCWLGACCLCSRVTQVGSGPDRPIGNVCGPVMREKRNKHVYGHWNTGSAVDAAGVRMFQVLPVPPPSAALPCLLPVYVSWRLPFEPVKKRRTCVNLLYDGSSRPCRHSFLQFTLR